MATEICLNEGKDWLANHAVAGATLFGLLLVGSTVAGATITATSTLSGLIEATGTGYARQSVTIGSSTNGIMAVPSVSWNTTTNSNWSTNVTAWALASASSGGVGVFVWDLLTPRNMAAVSTTLTIPTLNWFYLNPGE